MKLLELLENSVLNIADLAIVFTVPYGSSIRHIEYRLAQSHRERNSKKIEKIKKRAFYDLLYRLERDGLMIRSKGKNSSSRLTALGKKMLSKLKLKSKTRPPIRRYIKVMENSLKIFMFDIPERERSKRNWLRSVLIHLGFSKLQKSVWTGKTKIPEEFLYDMKKLNLLSCVEILAVTKTGSLKQIELGDA